ncbi:thioredoxin family protein [archaeon]|nr:thioredoxin family protein [archaeon]
MELLLEIFTSPTCPHCPAAKRVAENVVGQMESALMIERDMATPEGAEAAARYGVKGVPTIVVNGKYKTVGVPTSEAELLSHLWSVK